MAGGQPYLPNQDQHGVKGAICQLVRCRHIFTGLTGTETSQVSGVLQTISTKESEVGGMVLPTFGGRFRFNQRMSVSGRPVQDLEDAYSSRLAS